MFKSDRPVYDVCKDVLETYGAGTPIVFNLILDKLEHNKNNPDIVLTDQMINRIMHLQIHKFYDDMAFMGWVDDQLFRAAAVFCTKVLDGLIFVIIPQYRLRGLEKDAQLAREWFFNTPYSDLFCIDCNITVSPDYLKSLDKHLP